MLESCVLCKQKISFIIRKHHCRFCDKLIYYKCCNKPSLKKTRLCKECNLTKNYDNISENVINNKMNKFNNDNKKEIKINIKIINDLGSTCFLSYNLFCYFYVINQIENLTISKLNLYNYTNLTYNLKHYSYLLC